MGAQKQRRSMAEKADKYKCYLKSVQSPEHEVEFFDKAFKDEFHRKPTTLREDFCGTFSVCCEWVKLGRQRTALGVDLDPEPLAWGEKHILSKLQSAQASRVRILEKDVREKNPASCRRSSRTKLFFLAIQDSQRIIGIFPYCQIQHESAEHHGDGYDGRW